MDHRDQIPRQINAALFVDFDNVYISLANQDRQVANQFAANPEGWLNWLEEYLPSPQLGLENTTRRILIRRCYLNPQSFSNYRPFFIRSAFEVIDCPPLTMQGKTSTDIHLVMDVLDALSHTHISEFIILSGDADFTPLLLRLRKHNRWSAAVSIGYVSPAYKAACDYVITQDTFIREALGFAYQEEETLEAEPREISQATEVLLRRMVQRLHEVAVDPLGIEASDLPDVYREFAEFRQSNRWLGFFSLRRLTEALVALRPDLVILEEDPWRVARHEQIQSWNDGEMVIVSDERGSADTSNIRMAMAEWIASTVHAADRAVTMAVLAQAAQQRFGDVVRSSAWLGAGTFKNLLTQLNLGELQLSTRTPGFVYDPARHEAPADVQSNGYSTASPDALDPFSLRYPDLAPLARKINRLTDTPSLVPEHYALLLQELAREINERGYQMTRTSKTVRDRCVEKGASVARSHVNFVLIGISYAGHYLGQNGSENARQLGEALVTNTFNLCATARLELTDEERSQVREWILGGLPPVVEVAEVIEEPQ